MILNSERTVYYGSQYIRVGIMIIYSRTPFKIMYGVTREKRKIDCPMIDDPSDWRIL